MIRRGNQPALSFAFCRKRKARTSRINHRTTQYPKDEEKYYKMKKNEGCVEMKINVAVISRIKEICKQRRISYYSLAFDSGVPYSTVKSLMKGRNGDIKLTTLKKILDGLDISVKEFFESELFDDLEQEIE